MRLIIMLFIHKLIKMTSIVINLDRRQDRLQNFINNYELYGPRIPLVRLSAVDGTEDFESTEVVNENSRVKACAQSHLNAIRMIAEGSHEYGIIFEDDANFRPDGLFKRNFDQILIDAKNHPDSIIYFGTGDILPMFLDIRSESLLRAQEKSHATNISGLLGLINYRSSFVFSWLGAWSYMLSSSVARQIINNVQSCPISRAMDLYLRDTIFRKMVTVPLLTYHGQLETSDSDIRK